MAENIQIKKFRLNGDLIYPATISDAVMHPELEEDITTLIDGLLEEKVILTEEEYEALDRKDPDKFYFTYEEED